MLRILAVTNMYPSPENPDSGTFVEQQIKGLERRGLEVAVLVVARIQKGMRAYFELAKDLRAQLAQFRPDIVHVMYGGVMAETVTRVIRDRPTIVSFCGDDLLGELLSGPMRKFIAGYGVLASYWAARRAAGIVVKSKNLENALPNWVPKSKVRIIPNGIDLERFKPLDRQDCNDRLGWNKRNFHVLISSAQPIKQPGLARNAVEVLKLSADRVELHSLGRVPHDEVPIWLNASDVLLLTSLHEGSPNIVKEALACDLPIVSLDVGDVRERIQGVDECYLADPNPTDLASKLALLHAKPCRIAGRASVQNISLEHIALRLEEFYEDVLLSWNTCHSNLTYIKDADATDTNLR
jgi:teichuronic acid biosynthesis glycosyltransferase TuaC